MNFILLVAVIAILFGINEAAKPSTSRNTASSTSAQKSEKKMMDLYWKACAQSGFPDFGFHLFPHAVISVSGARRFTYGHMNLALSSPLKEDECFQSLPTIWPLISEHVTRFNIAIGSGQTMEDERKFLAGVLDIVNRTDSNIQELYLYDVNPQGDYPTEAAFQTMIIGLGKLTTEKLPEKLGIKMSDESTDLEEFEWQLLSVASTRLMTLKTKKVETVFPTSFDAKSIDMLQRTLALTPVRDIDFRFNVGPNSQHLVPLRGPDQAFDSILHGIRSDWNQIESVSIVSSISIEPEKLGEVFCIGKLTKIAIVEELDTDGQIKLANKILKCLEERKSNNSPPLKSVRLRILPLVSSDEDLEKSEVGVNLITESLEYMTDLEEIELNLTGLCSTMAMQRLIRFFNSAPKLKKIKFYMERLLRISFSHPHVKLEKTKELLRAIGNVKTLEELQIGVERSSKQLNNVMAEILRKNHLPNLRSLSLRYKSTGFPETVESLIRFIVDSTDITELGMQYGPTAKYPPSIDKLWATLLLKDDLKLKRINGDPVGFIRKIFYPPTNIDKTLYTI